MPGLLELGRQSVASGDRALSAVSRMERNRNAANEQIKGQEMSSTASLVGTGAAAGFMFGGPIGAGIGAGVGLIAGTALFS